MRSADRARAHLLPRSPASDGERRPGPSAHGTAPRVGPHLTRLLVVVGPTGTGKSDLALELARALDGEIVGCDALQIYRGLDAATAKPSVADRRTVPHHLLDEIDPRRDFSLAEFVDRAERAIAAIAAQRRVPIVVGGTGLYLRGLLCGIVALPPRDEPLRSRLRAAADRWGVERLHRWLSRIDRVSAERIAPGDRQRVLRALELGLGTDRTWSERLRDEGSFDSGVERFATLKLGLTLERAALFRALDERVVRFFDAGLVQEVRTLLASGVPAGANALKAIGYREVVEALAAGVDPLDVLPQVQRSTRRYAKRQLTWFRREPRVEWLDAAWPRERIVERALALWHAPGAA